MNTQQLKINPTGEGMAAKKKNDSRIHIRQRESMQGQMARLGKNCWAVSRLVMLSKDLPTMDVPLKHLNVYNTYDNLTLREMVSHMRAVNASDLKYPIILDEDGEIMDGRHRIMKAMLEGKKTIKAVRFDENPSPCSRDE
jgi:hypothetical protein